MSGRGRRTDEERLRLFIDLVNDLSQRRAVAGSTMKSRLTFGWSQDSGASFTADTGDEDDVRSYYLAFRHLTANDSDAQFGKISNILVGRLTDGELRDAAKQNKDQWGQVMSGRLIQELDGRQFNAKRAFDLVSNGLHFHHDKNLRDIWDGLDSETRATFHVQANGLMLDGTRVAVAQRSVAIAAFGRNALAFD